MWLGLSEKVIDMNCEIWIELIWYESVDINGNKKWMIWVMNDENEIPVIVFNNISKPIMKKIIKREYV